MTQHIRGLGGSMVDLLNPWYADPKTHSGVYATVLLPLSPTTLLVGSASLRGTPDTNYRVYYAKQRHDFEVGVPVPIRSDKGVLAVLFQYTNIDYSYVFSLSPDRSVRDRMLAAYNTTTLGKEHPIRLLEILE